MQKRGTWVVVGIVAVIIVLAAIVTFSGSGDTALSARAVQPIGSKSTTSLFCKVLPFTDRCKPTSSSHYTCVNNACALVPGAGPSTCSVTGAFCGQSCTDSDGGINYLLRGTVTLTNSSGASNYTDFCHSNGNLFEFHCSENSNYLSSVISCQSQYGSSYFCQNGACLQNQTNQTNQSSYYLLTVSKMGSGDGLVTSNPAGINCGTDCTQSYAYSTSVVLTATPLSNSSNSSFLGWGGACSGTSTCTVIMTSNKNVTASFGQQNQTNQTVKPDLIVQDLIFYVLSQTFNSTTNQTQKTIRVSALVKNIGPVTAGASTTRFLLAPPGFSNTVSTNSIAPNQTSIVNYTYFNLNLGNYSVEVNADFFNVVVESSESNNARTESFLV